MAEINTVPLGQAGTGNAFVLGQSQAANQLVNTLQYNQQAQIAQQKLREQQAQQLANSWRQNQLKVDGGMYWQPEFNKRYQQHLEKGIQLRQMGVDPFNYNPNDPTQAKIAENYLLERQGILSDVDTRKALEANVAKQFAQVKGDPSAYYPSDIQALNEYVQTPFAQASTMQAPTLAKRFDPNTVLSKITPAQVANEIVVGNKKIKSVKALPQETRGAIVSAYTNSPATARWVDELTGRQGFTIHVLESIPNTRDAVKASVETTYAGDPDLRTELATQGILPNTPAFTRYVNDETERLYDAKTKWNNQIDKDLTQILPKVKQMESVLPDYSAEDQAMQRRGLQLREESAARAASKASGASSNVGEVQQITIPYGRGTGNERGVVEFDEYVPISLSKKNFAGAEYIDLKTGKPGGKLSSSNDYEVVGVGNAPIIKKGNFKGAVSQPNFANSNPDAIERKPIIHVQTPATATTPAKDYFVPYDRLPENVKNSKSVREALVNFKPASATTTKKNTPSKTKNDPLGLF